MNQQRKLIAQASRFLWRGTIGVMDQYAFGIEDARGGIHAAGDASAKRSADTFIQQHGSVPPFFSSIYIKTKMRQK